LKSVLPPDADESFFEYLKNADCSKIKIRAIKEGSIVFPMEPLLQIEGPLIIV
jgi:nicotinate phosphoribosyltransferase